MTQEVPNFFHNLLSFSGTLRTLAASDFEIVEVVVDGLRGQEVERRDVEDERSEVGGCGWFEREAARCRSVASDAIRAEFRAGLAGWWAGGQAGDFVWGLFGSGSTRSAPGDQTWCWLRASESSVSAEARISVSKWARKNLLKLYLLFFSSLL